MSRISIGITISMVLLSWPFVLAFAFPEYPQSHLPSVTQHLGGIVAVLLLTFVRSQVLFVFGIAWVAWYFVGALNIISSSLFLGQYYSNLDIGSATSIYLLGCSCYILGFIIFEKYSTLRTTQIEKPNKHGIEIGPPGKYFLMLFPIFWLLSLYAKVGYIPVLSGEDITDSIYEIDYGFLYPYTVVISMSALYVLKSLLDRKIVSWGWWYLGLIMLISFADGKRVVAMIFMGAAIPMLFSYLGRRAWRPILATLLGFVFLYVVVQILRQGGDLGRYQTDSITKFMAIGVEFRDFVFSVNYFEPGNVPNYAWFTSGVASMLNSNLLDLFGIDKNQYVRMGSAYVWAEQFKSSFGIRTGIVSELWFAYKYIGAFVLMLFGIITAIVVRLSNTSKVDSSRLFFGSVTGLFLTAIVGQTTAILGSVTVLFYVYILLMAETSVLRKPHI